jgi:hypothetical protein
VRDAAAAHGVAPEAPGTSIPVNQVLAITPGGSAGSDDTYVNSMTPSPHYSQDHTVFASGLVGNGCANPTSCPALFMTTDSGRTWAHRPTVGFMGGNILLPPAYPADATLFAMSPVGLQRSDDGSTFVTAVPTPGIAAADPLGAAGDAHIGVVAGTGGTVVIYSERSHATAPAGNLPPGVVPQTAAFDTSHTLLIVAETLSMSQPTFSLYRCATLPAGCSSIASLPGQGAAALTVIPQGGGAPMVMAAIGSAVYRSTDGGHTFSPTDISTSTVTGFTATAVVTGVRVVIGVTSADGSLSSIRVSDDGLRTFRDVTGNLPSSNFYSTMLALPDGRVLLALPAGGVRCSAGTLGRWSSACPS